MRWALPIAALLLAPYAAAQLPVVTATVGVFVEDPGRALVPGTIENVSVIVNYQPANGARPAPNPTPDRPENTTPTHITLTVKSQPSWVDNVTLTPNAIDINMRAENLTGATYSAHVMASIAVSPNAPALQRESFVVTAKADPNGNIQGSTADSPDLKLRATTVGKLNVSADPIAIVPGGRWTEVPFHVRNDGNSDIVAKVNVTVRPENSQVDFKNTLQLKRGETQDVIVRIRTPWTAAEFGALGIEAAPIVDGEPGKTASAEVDVRGTSAVPDAGAGALVALGALCALLARRAR